MRHIQLLFVLSLIFVFVSCGKKNEQDYWNKAVELQKKEKYSEAVENYETLARQFPQGQMAPRALFEAGKLLQSLALKDTSAGKSNLRAIGFYKMVYEKYPGSDEAPKALFMSGFIQSNELRNYTEATSAFKTFLDKYPSHELASSAKTELDNMGLTPEEIIMKKMKNGK